MLFTMYIKTLSAIIDSHSIIQHSFSDDLQLQMSAPPDGISELLHSMQSCISDVNDWATANMVKLNDNKTEFMLVNSNRTKHLHNLPTSITTGNAQIPFKHSVNNLGFTLDSHPTMNAHVFNIARTCYFELRGLASIRRFIKWNEMKWKSVIFKCYSSEKLITLNILHEAVPTRYSFHSWVDWSNADKESCSSKQNTVVGVRTVYLCNQKPTFKPNDQYALDCLWLILQLPHVYLLLFCQELTTVAHCCMVLLMMWHPTSNGCRSMQLLWSCTLYSHLT